MMFSSQFTGSILLATGLLFNTVQAAGEELIGYRAVTKKEADYINAKHRPNLEGEFDKGVLTPLGKGLHLVNSPDSLGNVPGDWYCGIKAEIGELKDFERVWIPFKDPETDGFLWFSDEEIIMNYVKKQIDDDADEAVRIAYRIGASAPNQLEMALPLKTLKDGDLDISGQCWERKEDLVSNFDNEVVDWESWGEIKGNPGPFVSE